MRLGSTVTSFFLVSVGSLSVAQEEQKPNFIVMQPDDLRFFEEWTPPPHYPTRAQVETFPCAETKCLPNIERLRQNGLQMMEAYTASSMCGTSRFSTITGRYPTRSAYSRESNFNQDVANVVIPTTKLQDVDGVSDGNDCTDHNLATLMKKNGYRTGVVGKWHLRRSVGDYDAGAFQNEIRTCGFDYVKSIYAENMNGNWHDGTFSHNMEYMTAKGIEFIMEDPTVPFFMYFNPTAPHSSGNVLEALTSFSCVNTPDGQLSEEPNVIGMTEGTNCAAYRQTVIDRANGSNEDNDLGSIWVDDAVGALLKTLEGIGQLDNTFFLFQMDHGQEGKGTLWEPGLRLSQFIHFPDKLSAGSQFNGMVSTVDIGPTILDYAGIAESSPGYYSMDGKSWRSAVETTSTAAFSTWDDDRCLFFELDRDRAVRCGCYKYLNLENGGDTFVKGSRRGLAVDANDREILFNLCDSNGNYELDTNQETTDVKASESAMLGELRAYNDCHLERTKANQDPEYSSCGYTPAPTIAPTSAPTTGVGGGICFSGEMLVDVKGKGSIKMSRLQLGDEVLVSKSGAAGSYYEPVYSFGHRHEYIIADYLQLLPSKLELSPHHMVFIRGNSGGDAIPASTVKVGDILLSGEHDNRPVSAIRHVKRKGAYAPFTASGTLIVNGVQASSFVSLQEGAPSFMVGSWKTPLTWQWLAHTFEAPHRLACHLTGNWCYANESYTPEGISTWVAKPLEMTQWLLLDQHAILVVLAVLPLTAALVMVSLLEAASYYSPFLLVALYIMIRLLRQRLVFKVAKL